MLILWCRRPRGLYRGGLSFPSSAAHLKYPRFGRTPICLGPQRRPGGRRRAFKKVSAKSNEGKHNVEPLTPTHHLVTPLARGLGGPGRPKISVLLFRQTRPHPFSCHSLLGPLAVVTKSPSVLGYNWLSLGNGGTPLYANAAARSVFFLSLTVHGDEHTFDN